jgi:hypothetical protein
MHHDVSSAYWEGVRADMGTYADCSGCVGVRSPLLQHAVPKDCLYGISMPAIFIV